MTLMIQEQLYASHLPKRFHDALDGMARFLFKIHKLREQHDEATELAAIGLHDRLALLAAELLPPHVDHVDTAEAERAFVGGALRLLYYRDTVLDDRRLLDTVGSKTLAEFEPDLRHTPDAGLHLRRALQEAFALDDEALAGIEEEYLKPELEALALRHTIIDGIEALLPVEAHTAETDAQVLALFDALFPGNPLRAGEVDLVRTSTSLYFCIPYEDMRLTTRLDDVFEDADVEGEVHAFLEQITDLRQRYMAHFPVFGFFRGEHADVTFLDRLEAETGLDRETMVEALTTMVAVLPSGEVDKYIIHDAWGHQWQALLFRFERAYRDIASYRYLPDIERVQPDVGVSLLGILDDAVEDVAEGGAFDKGRWDDYMRAEMSVRLVQSMSGLLAEVLADVVEFKFLALNPKRRQDMPSSSFFKTYPAKLDLTLADLSLYFWFATKGFERFSERPARQEALVEAYLARRPGADRGAVEGAVKRLARRTAAWFEDIYRREFTLEVNKDQTISTNVFGRCALNFLGFQTVLNALYSELEQEPDREGLLVRFQDLLVFTTATFYEHDRARNFWHVDEFVGLFFEPSWRKLLQALESG